MEANKETISVCRIAQYLMIHQIGNTNSMFNAIKLSVPEMSENDFEKAIAICFENGVISSKENDFVCQTLSLLKTQLTTEQISLEAEKYKSSIIDS